MDARAGRGSPPGWNRRRRRRRSPGRRGSEGSSGRSDQASGDHVFQGPAWSPLRHPQGVQEIRPRTQTIELGREHSLVLDQDLVRGTHAVGNARAPARWFAFEADRKSTRLNSSHVAISYAVIRQKKKKKHHLDG